jgi:hypothetical protein
MAVGKRTSTDQPLTEHDVAERLDKAMLRVTQIMMEVDGFGVRADVRSSSYSTNIGDLLAAKLDEWGYDVERGKRQL